MATSGLADRAHRIRALIASPWLYTGWFVIVLAALAGTYLAHPHIFAFTTLGLGLASIVPAILALVVCFLERRARLAILSPMVLTGVSIFIALYALSRFKWA